MDEGKERETEQWKKRETDDWTEGERQQLQSEN